MKRLLLASVFLTLGFLFFFASGTIFAQSGARIVNGTVYSNVVNTGDYLILGRIEMPTVCNNVNLSNSDVFIHPLVANELLNPVHPIVVGNGIFAYYRPSFPGEIDNSAVQIVIPKCAINFTSPIAVSTADSPQNLNLIATHLNGLIMAQTAMRPLLHLGQLTPDGINYLDQILPDNLAAYLVPELYPPNEVYLGATYGLEAIRDYVVATASTDDVTLKVADYRGPFQLEIEVGDYLLIYNNAVQKSFRPSVEQLVLGNNEYTITVSDPIPCLLYTSPSPRDS